MKYLYKNVIAFVGLLLLSFSAFAETGGDLNLTNKASLSSRDGYKLTLGTEGDNIEFIVDGTRKGYINSTGLNGFVVNSPTLSDPVISGNLTFAAVNGRIVPGTSSLSFRNNANSASNLQILDSGEVTVRGGYRYSGAGNNAFIADSGTDKGLIIGGGNGSTTSTGGIVSVYGNTSLSGGGEVSLRGGNVAAGGVYIGPTHASAPLSLSTSAGTAWSIPTSAGVFTQNATNGGNILFQKANTGVVAYWTTKAAAGSSISDATQLDSEVTTVTGASGTNGVKAALLSIGQSFRLFNSSGSALLVYPPSGSVTLGNGNGNSMSVASNATMVCYYESATVGRCTESGPA